MSKFEVYEDNGGGLHLVTFDTTDNVVYAHSGYEFHVGQLIKDLQALEDGDDPIADAWEGNDEDPQALYDCLSKASECNCVADNDGIFPAQMGVAARDEFGIRGCGDEPTDYIPWYDMETLSDGSIPWDRIDIVSGGISRQKEV